MAEKDNSYEEYLPSSDLEEKETLNLGEKFKSFLSGSYFVVLIVILVAIISFSIGKYLNIKEGREPVKIVNVEQASSVVLASGVASSTGQARPSSPAASDAGGRVVGSKSGTKYHYPWCPGAKQIAAKNLITFNSIEEAKARGYTPAANCKGLK